MEIHGGLLPFHLCGNAWSELVEFGTSFSKHGSGQATANSQEVLKDRFQSRGLHFHACWRWRDCWIVNSLCCLFAGSAPIPASRHLTFELTPIHPFDIPTRPCGPRMKLCPAAQHSVPCPPPRRAARAEATRPAPWWLCPDGLAPPTCRSSRWGASVMDVIANGLFFVDGGVDQSGFGGGWVHLATINTCKTRKNTF